MMRLRTRQPFAVRINALEEMISPLDRGDVLFREMVDRYAEEILLRFPTDAKVLRRTFAINTCQLRRPTCSRVRARTDGVAEATEHGAASSTLT